MLPVFHETLFNNYQGNNSNRLFRTSYKMWFSGKKTLKHVSLLCIKKHQVALQHTKQQRRKKTMQDIWVDTGISLAAIPFPTPINVTALTPPHPPTPYELPRASSTYPPPSTTHIPKSNQQSLSRLLTTNKGKEGAILKVPMLALYWCDSGIWSVGNGWNGGCRPFLWRGSKCKTGYSLLVYVWSYCIGIQCFYGAAFNAAIYLIFNYLTSLNFNFLYT